MIKEPEGSVIPSRERLLERQEEYLKEQFS